MMIDKFLQDYKDGLINEIVLQSRLNFLARAEEYKQCRRSIKYPVGFSSYVQAIAKSPEEIIMEQEDYEELLTILSELRSVLSSHQFEIFWFRYIQGWPRKKIADKFQITEQAVSDVSLRAARKVKQWFLGSKLAECIQPRPPRGRMNSVQVKVHYPMDFLSRISLKGLPKKKNGRKYIYCLLPQYLDGSFGDEQTCCAYCDICKNNEMKNRIKNFV